MIATRPARLTYRIGSPEAKGATATATNAAVDASRATTSCGEEPSNAYAIRGRTQLYSPAIGGTPATSAIPMLSGTAIVTISSPAVRSRGSHRHR